MFNGDMTNDPCSMRFKLPESNLLIAGDDLDEAGRPEEMSCRAWFIPVSNILEPQMYPNIPTESNGWFIFIFVCMMYVYVYVPAYIYIFFDCRITPLFPANISLKINRKESLNDIWLLNVVSLLHNVCMILHDVCMIF